MHSITKFAVAAENEVSARAGLQILEQGGSAVDAAIAVSAMLGVTTPVACGRSPIRNPAPAHRCGTAW